MTSFSNTFRPDECNELLLFWLRSHEHPNSFFDVHVIRGRVTHCDHIIDNNLRINSIDSTESVSFSFTSSNMHINLYIHTGLSNNSRCKWAYFIRMRSLLSSFSSQKNARSNQFNVKHYTKHNESAIFGFCGNEIPKPATDPTILRSPRNNCKRGRQARTKSMMYEKAFYFSARCRICIWNFNGVLC